VVRGGSWINDNPANLSGSYRNNDHPENRNDNNGFRCVLGGVGSARRCQHRKIGEVPDRYGLSGECQEVT
jgi:hypothetical protein